MHRPFRGYAELKGADRTFKLHLDVAMLVDLQRETGLALRPMLAELNSIDMDLFAKIFWVAARRHHPKATQDDVMEAMSDAGMEGMEKAMEGLFREIMPEAAEGAVDPRKPAATPATDGTGGSCTESGARPATRRATIGSKPRDR